MVLQIFHPSEPVFFPSARLFFSLRERSRMFLICSRSFSLSSFATLSGSPLESQKWKKESLSPHGIQALFARMFEVNSTFVLIVLAVLRPPCACVRARLPKSHAETLIEASKH